jgi:hypothetical protein
MLPQTTHVIAVTTIALLGTNLVITAMSRAWFAALESLTLMHFISSSSPPQLSAMATSIPPTRMFTCPRPSSPHPISLSRIVVIMYILISIVVIPVQLNKIQNLINMR